MLSKEQYTKCRDLLDRHNDYIQKFKKKNGWIVMKPHEVQETNEFLGDVVTNEMRAEVEEYEFVNFPPDRYFAYIDGDKVTGFMGNVLGTLKYTTRSSKPAFTMWAINGKVYRGQAFPKSGSYCRLRLA